MVDRPQPIGCDYAGRSIEIPNELAGGEALPERRQQSSRSLNEQEFEA